VDTSESSRREVEGSASGRRAAGDEVGVVCCFLLDGADALSLLFDLPNRERNDMARRGGCAPGGRKKASGQRLIRDYSTNVYAVCSLARSRRTLIIHPLLKGSATASTRACAAPSDHRRPATASAAHQTMGSISDLLRQLKQLCSSPSCRCVHDPPPPAPPSLSSVLRREKLWRSSSGLQRLVSTTRREEASSERPGRSSLAHSTRPAALLCSSATRRAGACGPSCSTGGL
jgi:hypothetical protein